MSLHANCSSAPAEGKPIRIGLIGAGKFGSMYLAQIPRTPGVHLVGIADLSPDGARAQPGARRLERRADARRVSLDAGAEDAARRTSARTGRRWSRIRRSTSSSNAPATRSPRSSTAWRPSRNGKHVVNVTVEADAFCGPLLARKARRGRRRSIRSPSATSRR